MRLGAQSVPLGGTPSPFAERTHIMRGVEDRPRPEDMRRAMCDYVRAVHQSYVSQADLQPPAVRGRMPLLGDPFTVVAAGVRNLHVVATREGLGAPVGPEVEVADELPGMRWTLRFFDPVVLPALGLIDEFAGAAGDRVRRALGLTTYLYHLIVQPGSELTGHHAGHAGAGLANAHAAEARDFEEIRAHARGRERLVDEMEGASHAGLVRAQLLLAREIAPWDDSLGSLDEHMTLAEVRKAVLGALRGESRGG
jgi:hypothetical protein